jgi:hypothetical protein
VFKSLTDEGKRKKNRGMKKKIKKRKGVGERRRREGRKEEE